ncbi:MAG: ABC transporter ATP-binding protein [Ignavibacteriales bacterium]|nr:ABC transporter ATP-binding protein [Ignavibacteriales bacterium]
MTPSRVFFRLLTYFVKYRWRVAAGLVSVAMMSVSDTLSAFLVARLFDFLLVIGDQVKTGKEIAATVPLEFFGFVATTFSVSGRDEGFWLIMKFAAAVIIIIVVKVCFVYAREYVMSSAQQKILMRFRTDLFDTVVMLPIRYFDKNKTGYIMSRITNDVNALEQSLGMIVEISQNIVYTVIFGVALFLTNWQLALFTLILFAASGEISRKFGDRIRTFSHSFTNTLADISSFLQEKIASIRIVKSFTREQYEKEAFRHKVGSNYDYSMKITRVVALLSPTNEFFNTVVTTLFVVFTGFLFFQGSMTMEMMIRFLLLVTFVAKPVKALGESAARIQKTLVSAGYIFEILDLEKEKLSPAPRKQMVERGDVEFKNVSFTYNGELDALSDISFVVKSGEKVALVGPSGSGKSTLINLIPRFYEITHGSAFIDGTEIREFSLIDLRSQIALVPQDVTLFAGSVYDNIRYGRLDAPQDDVFSAAKAANAHQFIESMAKGYETEIGERGVQLSGGQRQRIAIARAILRDPKILLLDEATSALDTESEMAVQEALDRLMRGRTSFIIAHRLSTVHHCDRILVLDRGKIVESGTHDVLMQRGSGLYKRLYSLQFADERTFAKTEI